MTLSLSRSLQCKVKPEEFRPPAAVDLLDLAKEQRKILWDGGLWNEGLMFATAQALLTTYLLGQTGLPFAQSNRSQGIPGLNASALLS